MEITWDVAIVGGGIVGAATAMALGRHSKASVLLIEAEKDLASHQTGHNSGVIHSGLYYRHGSLKASLCITGRDELYRFCSERGVAHDPCGKIVVATRESEIPSLDELERRGRANGIPGLRRLGSGQIAEIEPHCTGIEGLLVPATGIVDYPAVTRAFAQVVSEQGGEIRTAARLLAVGKEHAGITLDTAAGTIHVRNIINCAGLQSDRVARLCGTDPGMRIVPFRGEYYVLRPASRTLVRNLIYPVPDPRFPFLGVHFTRMIDGGVEAGPNAVLAFKREGYRKRDVSLVDVASWVLYPGFWRMAERYWEMGMEETWRSCVKSAFVGSMRELIPEITTADVIRGGAGVRAQALLPDGNLADDFCMVQDRRMIHVLNAPSPAATASMAIGRTIADLAIKSFSLASRKDQPPASSRSPA